ncbi:MAG: hypothetical protein IT377_10760 [Polyangiaceae bacterium]|nr:hypothetical protein [Polyangiaceae bacterium]
MYVGPVPDDGVSFTVAPATPLFFPAFAGSGSTTVAPMLASDGNVTER